MKDKGKVFCQVSVHMKQSNHEKDEKKSETFFSLLEDFFSLLVPSDKETESSQSKAKQSKARCHFLSQLNTIDVSSISRKDKPRSWTKKVLNKKYLYNAFCIEQVHLEKKVKFYSLLVDDYFFNVGQPWPLLFYFSLESFLQQ